MTLQVATFAARERTGKLIAVAVKAGLFQVQSITYQKRGRSIVEPLSGWLAGPSVIPFLEGLQ